MTTQARTTIRTTAAFIFQREVVCDVGGKQKKYGLTILIDLNSEFIPSLRMT